MTPLKRALIEKAGHDHGFEHVTGLHADHLALSGLAGMVAARTSPALQVRVEALQVGGVPVAKITVPKAQCEVATQAGVYVRRRIKHDGTPECVPMLPHERISRASSFGLVDVWAQPVAGGMQWSQHTVLAS